MKKKIKLVFNKKLIWLTPAQKLANTKLPAKHRPRPVKTTAARVIV